MRPPDPLPAGPRTRRSLPTALRRHWAHIVVCLLALALLSDRIPAQSPSAPLLSFLPNAPLPTTASASLTGIVTDPDGAGIANARITLATPPTATPALSATSTFNGVFTLTNIPAGPYALTIAAPGFATYHVSGSLQPGQSSQLATVALAPAADATVKVTATQTEVAEAEVHQEEKQRVLGVFPNFYVSYVSNPTPLTPHQKFQLAFRTLVDPVSFALNGVAAGVQQADNVYSWGQGWPAYGKRYAAAYGTFLDGTLIGSAILPSVLHQDPRYFVKGTGSIPTRMGYAIANAVICKGDNHHWQFNYSAVGGGLAASGISNLYYPKDNRAGPRVTFEAAAFGTAFTAVSNIIQEFASRKLTPHVPDTSPEATTTATALDTPTKSHH